MAALLLQVGAGIAPAEAVAEALLTGRKPPLLKTAPAHGLFLHRVICVGDGADQGDTVTLPEEYRGYADALGEAQRLRGEGLDRVERLDWSWKWRALAEGRKAAASGVRAVGQGQLEELEDDES